MNHAMRTFTELTLITVCYKLNRNTIKLNQGAKLKQVLRIAKIQQTSCKITSKLQLYHERQNKTNVFCCL